MVTGRHGRAVPERPGEPRARTVALDVWTWQFPTDDYPPFEDDVTASLIALADQDCRWEWCSGTFTIQRLKRPKEDAPYPSLVDEIDALRIRVAP